MDRHHGIHGDGARTQTTDAIGGAGSRSVAGWAPWVLILVVLAACGPTAAAPKAPDGVEATATAEGVVVTWNDRSDNEAGFIVYRGTAPTSSVAGTDTGHGPGSTDGAAGATIVGARGSSPRASASELTEIGRTEADVESFTDGDVEPGTLYTYAVGSFAGTHESSQVPQSGAPVGAATSHAVVVQLAGSGQGSVSSDPAGISCGSTCSADFTDGLQVTLTAQAAAGSAFTGWTDDCSGAAATCSLTVSADHSVGATFDLIETDIVVTSAGGGVGGPDCTLRDAITAANLDAATGGCPAGHGDDVIQLPTAANIGLSEVDNVSDRANGLPSIVSVITIEGNGSTITRAADEPLDFRLFHVAEVGTLTLNDTVLVGGYDRVDTTGEDTIVTAGGIYNRGHLNLDQTSLRAAGARGPSVLGAALANLGGDVTLAGGTLEDNVTDDCFEGCGGTALTTTGGTVALTGVTIRNNGASGDDTSGAVDVRGGTVIVTGGTFEGNSAYYGGAIWISPSGTVSIDGSTFTSNRADDTGGAVANRGQLTVTDSVFSANFASFYGGAISNDGDLTITGSTFSGRDGVDAEDDGGAIRNLAGTVSIGGGTVIEGFEAGRGAAISNEDGTVVITDSTIRNNSAGSGGAIFNAGSGTVEIHDTVLSGNFAETNGGAIYQASGSLEMDAGQICDNSANVDGGGVYLAAGSLGLENGAAITGNTADADDNDSGTGGGVYVVPGATLDAAGGTITDNAPDDVAP